MTINILEGDGEMNKKELDFFLKGNVSLDDVDDPCPVEWVTISGWKDIQVLHECNEVFKTFIDDFKSNLDLFKQWYDLEKPENSELPLHYNKLTTF